jgi:hypothetical protein
MHAGELHVFSRRSLRIFSYPAEGGRLLCHGGPNGPIDPVSGSEVQVYLCGSGASHDLPPKHM